VRESASRRRAEIEERYHEELRALDAELAAIETMERLAGEFATKHLRTESAASAEPEPLPQSTPSKAAESRSGSRWRVHFSSPAGGEEPAQS
jgi:hypothetical protein